MARRTTMERHNFTEEQMQELRSNPFTRSVSPTTLKFTDEFKDKFWELYVKGIQPADIFIELGYNPATLGKRRIANTTCLISSSRVPKSVSESDKDKRLEKAESEIRSLRSELDTLKKIIALENSLKRRR